MGARKTARPPRESRGPSELTKILNEPFKPTKPKRSRKPTPPTTEPAPTKKKQAARMNDSLLAAAKEILPRLQAGETTLSAERDRLALKSNSALRKALTQVLGGKEAYRQMMDAVIGPRREAGGPIIPKPSDDDVPVIGSTKYKDGWHTRTMRVHAEDIPVFVSPDGDEYVHAKGNERADLIVDHSHVPGLDKYRLRKLETSSVGRAAKKEEKLVERGTKARKEKRQAKKVRRKGPGIP